MVLIVNTIISSLRSINIIMLKKIKEAASSAVKASNFAALVATSALTVAMAPVVLPTPQAEAQINVTSPRTGTCYTGRYRNGCFYPSLQGAYSNVQSIEITGASGADVYFIPLTPRDYTFGWSSGAVLTIGGRVYAKGNPSKCVIGFRQYGQNPVCYNPFRGTNKLVTIVVAPHNTNWYTKFTLNPD
jgi:hypothetical protein